MDDDVTSSSREGVGTPHSTASCVWFTLSHGILNEIYYPTIDRPQIREMEFLIADGATFFHEKKRDQAPVRFTLFWPEAHWEGRDYEMEVLA
jgi:GH15 family glucan-1,4-alpha-glucosidase